MASDIKEVERAAVIESTQENLNNDVFNSNQNDNIAINTKQELDLNHIAKTLISLQAGMPPTPEINKTLVDKIKVSLNAGDYKVNKQNIAKKMLEMELVDIEKEA